MRRCAHAGGRGSAVLRQRDDLRDFERWKLEVSNNCMKKRSTTQKPRPSVTPMAVRVLQRKCACGNQATGGGECSECQKKNHSLQRKAHNSDNTNDRIPPIVDEVLGSSGQPLNAATRSFMEPRFEHDFSGVRVHTD